MTLLRIGLGIYAALFVVGGYVLFLHSQNVASVVTFGYLLINSAVLVAGILFERGRYSQSHDSEVGWQPTKEKFIDDSSGKLVHVDYHPVTGQRRYRED